MGSQCSIVRSTSIEVSIVSREDEADREAREVAGNADASWEFDEQNNANTDHEDHISSMVRQNARVDTEDEECQNEDKELKKREAVDRMSLDAVATELALGVPEFRQFCLKVSMVKSKITPRQLKLLLHSHAVILKASQAKQIMEIIMPKFDGRRAELVMSLHSHCVEPYVMWEDDGEQDCIWENMAYCGERLWESGLCEDLHGVLKGPELNFTGVDACRGGCGHWAGTRHYCSLCYASTNSEAVRNLSRPRTLWEARRMFRKDVSNLRKGLVIFLANGDRKCALEKLVVPEFGEFVGADALNEAQTNSENNS